MTGAHRSQRQRVPMREPSEHIEEKHATKSPFLAHQLSLFFASARYRVVKITRSYSEVV
jgi:hypothetical protein